MGLAERVQQRRKVLGLSQKALAERLNLTQGAVAQLEAGIRSPSGATMSRLAKVLGVSVDYLLAGEEAAILDISELSLGDRELIRRFSDFLRQAKKG